MNNLRLIIRSLLPVTFCYLLLIGLISLLVILYNLPLVFLGDTLRFSLPILIVWIGHVVITHHRLTHIQSTNLQNFTPTNPTEAKLISLFQTQQNKNTETIRQLHLRQRQQFDHLELFSHEIKNYLTSLNAAAENSTSVANHEVKENVRQANYYLNLMLNDERLAIDNHDYNFQWIKLSPLVNEIIQQNSAAFIHKQLTPELTGLTDVWVLTDRKWLRFCIEQLLSNAIKYSHSNTTINISWEINSLKITDTGQEISASDRPRIFENGFTGKNGHQTTASTGMGLYLVKKVTAQLNFQVKVFSTTENRTTAQLIFNPQNVKHR